MGEIRIEISSLDEEIKNLEKLKKKIDSLLVRPPKIIGGGLSVQQLEDIEKMYKKIHRQIGTLVLNTILFMDDIRETLLEQEEEISKQF